MSKSWWGIVYNAGRESTKDTKDGIRHGRRGCHTTATFVPFVLFVDQFERADMLPAF
jgi:hypothetical protein